MTTRSRPARSCSACISTRRTGRGKRRATKRNRERLRGSNLRDFDGGTQKTYQRMIEAMDLQIGRVLQALDANGLADNTIVIFTSDNGGERFADTWPFTGRKTELLEGGLRIPAMISLAGAHSGRARSATRWRSAWTGCRRCWRPPAPRRDPDFPPDGMNLLPMLTGTRAPVPRKLFWRYKANCAARRCATATASILKILDNTFLFNVVEDPMERANLKERRKDVFDRLVADWHAWNATMLPEISRELRRDLHRAQLADHIGAR